MSYKTVYELVNSRSNRQGREGLNQGWQEISEMLSQVTNCLHML